MIALVANQILYPEIIIRSTVSITSNLISSIHYLSSISKGDAELQKLLAESDIVTDITVIKCFIIESEKLSERSPSVNNCIKNLSRTLENLEANINSISRKIQIHKQLWFRQFRSYNIQKEMELIPHLIIKMKHRFELLITIANAIK